MAAERVLTIDQLAEVYRLAFDQVCNQADWRGPVSCFVPFDVANLYMQAIEFMTGEKPDARRAVNGTADGFWLTSIGYRNGKCGS